MNRVFIAQVAVCASLASGAAQSIELRPAPALSFPAETDSNSPALRQDGTLVLYNSTGLGPVRSSGPNQFRLSDSQAVVLGRSNHRPYWIEAVWAGSDGAVFAWYHHEPPGVCGVASRLTAPQIGALVSRDGGRNFEDLGIVLMSGDPADCSSQNGYFAGGNGDFSVILSRDAAYFYFLFSNYGGPLESQGVAMARMPFARRYNPIGAVEKFYAGAWGEAGIGGRVSPIFPAAVAWQRADTDSFWGPSVHWNTYLNKFVVLLNRSCCGPAWPQEGIYASFNDTLDDPTAWTPPVKVLDGGDWYPQILGRAPDGTDQLAGRVARFYMHGLSTYKIVFIKAAEAPPPIIEEGESDAETRSSDGPSFRAMTE